jgi:hypothetical protein
MNNTATYVFNNVTFPIEIKVSDAFRIKADHGINLLQMFEGDNLDKLSLTLTFNDEKVIDIWWDYVSTKFTDREKCIDLLTRDDLTKFKEAFWAAIINFSDQAGKKTLLLLKKQLPALVERQVLQNIDDLLSNQQKENSQSTS